MKTIRLKVSEIDRISTDAILIYLEPYELGLKLTYEPGQFITFIFDRNDRELRRSYSIFTTPGVDTAIGVLVKRLVNGEVSRYLIDHLKPGEMLEALAPSGRFTLEPTSDPSEDLVFLTAGSGISPVFSLIKQALYLRDTRRVALLYQSRNEDSILFDGELSGLEKRFGDRFSRTNFLSNPSSHEIRPQRLNNTTLERVLLSPRFDLARSRFYLCGPPAFMRMCQFVLQFLGVPMARIHREIFFLSSAPASPLVHDNTPRKVNLQWQSEQFSFTVQYPQSILDAALKQGIHPPYSCKGGRCSTCAVKCVSGRVTMSINEVLTDRDLKGGWVLTCTGFPESDLELMYP